MQRQKGEVIRKITTQDAASEHLLAGLAARRRHVGEKNAMIWISYPKRLDQRLRRACLTY